MKMIRRTDPVIPMACYTLDETQSYTIDMRRNESGFHFVITQTNGMEWFPNQ